MLTITGSEKLLLMAISIHMLVQGLQVGVAMEVLQILLRSVGLMDCLNTKVICIFLRFMVTVSG